MRLLLCLKGKLVVDGIPTMMSTAALDDGRLEREGRRTGELWAGELWTGGVLDAEWGREELLHAGPSGVWDVCADMT